MILKKAGGIWWKSEEGAVGKKCLSLGHLKKNIVKITEGYKVFCITDAFWSDGNIGKMVELANGGEILFIEAHFLDKDAAVASAKYHLKAR
jgi:hypothetical protein